MGLQASGSKGNNHLFRDLDVLRNAEGMKAIISQRLSNGVITFSIVREFVRDGQTETTSFIPMHQIDAFADLVTLVKKRCKELEADPDLATRK